VTPLGVISDSLPIVKHSPDRLAALFEQTADRIEVPGLIAGHFPTVVPCRKDMPGLTELDDAETQGGSFAATEDLAKGIAESGKVAGPGRVIAPTESIGNTHTGGFGAAEWF
jgi:hypothetical protein